MDITIGNRNEYTKRFNFVRGADGDVSFDDTEAHAVVTSVIERKGTYAFDENHGSDLYKLKHITTPSQAEAMTLDSLVSLENESAITNAKAVATTKQQANGLGQLRVDLGWTTPSGDPASATVER